ncbi:MAG: fibronectin type III-like domain-contianing protein, partial [Gammaproteobacteria bacterium]|nr:fibronectin type III-like domain-contianing protein [Gammaproteobacteria bacterium]
GKSHRVAFRLDSDDLAFYGQDMKLITEPGEFRTWIGGSSNAQLGASFTLLPEVGSKNPQKQ